MSEKILVPVLGESITEATVSKWLKSEGDTVDVDEPIVELETDKVNLEVPSPVSGVLTKINSKDGSVVEVGAHLGSVSEDNSSSTIGSSAETGSPSFLSHFETVASVILSPRTGTKIFSLIINYSKTFIIISCC